jgi:hypothetical protein
LSILSQTSDVPPSSGRPKLLPIPLATLYRVFSEQSDTGISWQTEGHLFDDHLISGSVSVMPSSVIEATVVFCVSMTSVSQCPISLRAEHPVLRKKVCMYVCMYVPA